MSFEAFVDRLLHQRDAVGEEEHALHPVAAREQVAQCDHCTRFSRASCHYDQSFAVLVFFERLTDAPDGASLIVTLDNRFVDFCLAERLA